MTRKPMTLLAVSTVLGGLVAATAAFAEATPPASPPSQRDPGMMGDHHGMMTMMRSMGPDQMQQMTRMVDACNHMMEGMGNAPTGPGPDRAPGHHDGG
jgi:Spy/CpxP family protein refolding chaperone